MIATSGAYIFNKAGKRQTWDMKHRLSDSLKLPADLSHGDILISITGLKEVFIENYKGIVEYTDTNILLASKNGQVALAGKRLTITYYTNDEMKIEGTLDSIKFLD